MEAPEQAWRDVLQAVDNAAQRAGRPRQVALLAVSKTRDAAAVRTLAQLGQRSFGENYVQEAVGKRQALLDLDLDWQLIGHLQSNKAREAAETFDWVQSVDRPRIAEALSRYRPVSRAPLNVLIQVNIDDETSKSGCHPDQVAGLAEAIAGLPGLRLRGLMAIPSPAGPEQRRRAFRAMKVLFDTLKARWPALDTLSMGMSEDFELAIAEGATQVRIGSALFGARG